MAKLTGTGVSGSDIFCTARVKSYPGGRCEALVCDKAIFGGSGWEARQGSRVKASRAKDGGHDVARVNRYDVREVTRHLNHWLDNQVRRKGLAYVLVPERHKDGAIHFHGFFNDALEARDSGTVSLPGQKAPRRPRSARQRAKWLEDGGKPVYNLPGWSWGFTTAIELYGEYDRAVSYVCKYIGKELAPSPNGDGLEPQKIGGRWYYSGGALGRPQVTYAELDFRQAEQEPGAYRFDLPQAGISFVQFQFQAKGGENSGEPVGKVTGSQSEVPLVGAVRQPPLLGLRPGVRGAPGGGP